LLAQRPGRVLLVEGDGEPGLTRTRTRTHAHPQGTRATVFVFFLMCRGKLVRHIESGPDIGCRPDIDVRKAIPFARRGAASARWLRRASAHTTSGRCRAWPQSLADPCDDLICGVPVAAVHGDVDRRGMNEVIGDVRSHCACKLWNPPLIDRREKRHVLLGAVGGDDEFAVAGQDQIRVVCWAAASLN